MNFTETVLTLAFASTLFFSCKDTASSTNPSLKETPAEVQKENTIAVKPETRKTMQIKNL